MYIYSSLYIGNYFLFLVGADGAHPVRLYFREHEEKLRGRNRTGGWKEKVYLYPAILQKKWIEYKYRDRFIPSAGFDNVLPLEIACPPVNRASVPIEATLVSNDKDYREITLSANDRTGTARWEERIEYVRRGKDRSFTLSIPDPGIYTFNVTCDDVLHVKKTFFFLPDAAFCGDGAADFPSAEEAHDLETYCGRCGSRIYPLVESVSEGYEYRNYIPFKDYIDFEGLGMNTVTDFITTLPHSGKYKRGLVHLLNMLRLAGIEDEMTIVKNLFTDDPEFAYFITHRLFLFQMIPLMEDRVLQDVLNRTDDDTIAAFLKGESPGLVRKVLMNVSKRRAESIQKMYSEPASRDGESVKSKMEKDIRLHFEERFGRVLKIPARTTLRYTVTSLDAADSPPFAGHGAALVVKKNEGLLLCRNPALGLTNETCVPYDMESSLDSLFSVTAVTDSAVLLKCETKLKTAMVHVYDWTTGIEYCETAEYLTENSIVPVPRPSDAVVLTVGAVDRKDRGREQVIRLKAH